MVVVSNDINLRIKCDAIGVEAEAYATENVIEKGNELYSGFTKVLVDDQIVDRFYEGEGIILSDVVDDTVELYNNQFVMLVSSSNDKKTAITRYLGEYTPLKKIPEYKGEGWGITPKIKNRILQWICCMMKTFPLYLLLVRLDLVKLYVQLQQAWSRLWDKIQNIID